MEGTYTVLFGNIIKKGFLIASSSCASVRGGALNAKSDGPGPRSLFFIVQMISKFKFRGTIDSTIYVQSRNSIVSSRNFAGK